MRDITIKVIIAALILALTAQYHKCRQTEERLEACQDVLQRVFLDKPGYYLDTLCNTEEYSYYMETLDFKEVPIDN